MKIEIIERPCTWVDGKEWLYQAQVKGDDRTFSGEPMKTKKLALKSLKEEVNEYVNLLETASKKIDSRLNQYKIKDNDEQD